MRIRLDDLCSKPRGVILCQHRIPENEFQGADLKIKDEQDEDGIKIKCVNYISIKATL